MDILILLYSRNIHINELPIEILSIILDCLDNVKHVAECRLVCRQWQALISNALAPLPVYITIECFSRQIRNSLQERWSEICEQVDLRTVELNGFEFTKKRMRDRPWLGERTSGEVQTALKIEPKARLDSSFTLERLHATFKALCSRPVTCMVVHADYQEIPFAVPFLVPLQPQHIHLSLEAEFPTKIELRTANDDDFDPHDVWDAYRSVRGTHKVADLPPVPFPPVKQISLHNAEIFAETLPQSIANLTSLESLAIDHLQNSTDISVLACLPRLRYLAVVMPRSPVPKMFQTFANLTTIQGLSITSKTFRRDAGAYIEMLKQMPQLQTLCQLITLDVLDCFQSLDLVQSDDFLPNVHLLGIRCDDIGDWDGQSFIAECLTITQSVFPRVKTLVVDQDNLLACCFHDAFASFLRNRGSIKRLVFHKFDTMDFEAAIAKYSEIVGNVG